MIVVSAMSRLLLMCLLLNLCLCETTKYVPKWKKQACEQQSSIAPNRRAHYTCTDEGEIKCYQGWTGDLCDVPICRKGCDPLNGYCRKPNECTCRLGYYGELCNKCIRMIGCEYGYCNSSFQCLCRDGWNGLFCSEPVCGPDCDKNHGYCTVPNECKCKFGWTGKNCSQCQLLPGCKHGYCNNPLECICDEHYKGVFCQTPICSEKCHKSQGYCRKPGECICKTGWFGDNCDQCYPYPGCKNGNCSMPWECNCEEGWGGLLCDKELLYCKERPDTCKNHGKCIPLEPDGGHFKCQCLDNYTGRHCEIEKRSMNSSIATTSTATATMLVKLKKHKVIKTTIFEELDTF